MTTLEVLRGARAKIAQGWCQGTAARDANGVTSSCFMELGACSWCAIGAIYGAAPVDELGEASADAAIAALVTHVPGNAIAPWNDSPSRTQAEVLELFDRAIATEERAA